MFFKIPDSLPPPQYFLRDYATSFIMWAVRGALLAGLLFSLAVCVWLLHRQKRK
ncbi:MAG: hypothetical protein PHC80_00090 [Eubacteriales bacterium]|nr:hypothetical protein [Eubacteriales bacterium]